MPIIIKIRHLVLALFVGLLFVITAIVLFMSISADYSLKVVNDFAYAGIALFLLLCAGSFTYQIRRVVFEWKTPKVADTIDADLVQTEEPKLKSYKILNIANGAFALLSGAFFVFMATQLPFSGLREYGVFVAVGYSAFGNLADFIDRRLWKQNERGEL